MFIMIIKKYTFKWAVKGVASQHENWIRENFVENPSEMEEFKICQTTPAVLFNY